MEQAREEELCCPSQTGPDPAQDVPISQIQIARRNSSSNNADASPEPTVEDNAGIAARPGDDNIEAGGIAESMAVSLLIRGPFSRTRTQVDCFDLYFLIQ